MREVISHMPMSPRLNPELGYWNIHCQARIASNLTNRPYVLSANLLGEKPNKNTDLSSTISFLGNLGLTPELVRKILQEGRQDQPMMLMVRLLNVRFVMKRRF